MKLISKSWILTILCSALVLSSCNKNEDNSADQPDLNVNENFSYSTTQEVTVNFTLNDHTDQPITGLRVNLYSPDGKKHIASGVSDASGIFSTLVRIPTYFDEVMVKMNYHGFDSDRLVKINGSSLTADFGGSGVPRGKMKTSSTQLVTSAGGNWYYMGGYNTLGVPNYLTSPGDAVSADLIADVSNSLPEFLDIPANKPVFLAPTNAYDINLTATGKVWVTYVAEGAGQKNTLGYYTFSTGNPPLVAGDIDSIHTLMPNTSNNGSGGGMIPGDKVFLGEFSAGTSIGWVLMANGWDDIKDSIKANNPNQTKFYSTYAFNPEGSASLRQHNVQLLDPARKIVFVGFEDVRRDYSSDNDFNDLLMYTTVTPYTSLDLSGLPKADYCDLDDDNDGVKNCDEDYRDDPLRAYNNYYTGTLGYEDLWPGKGDYDFNDLVVAYNTNQVTDAANNIKDIKTTYTVKAVGGAIHHGFGVQVDGLSPSLIESTTGTQSTQSLVTFDGKGLESGQTDAVLIAYDDIFDHIDHVSGEAFINTIKGNTSIATVDFQTDLTLTSAISPASIGLPPYNPFIFVRGNRGMEIHLADEKPTDLANVAAFGTVDDDSNPGTGRYYRTSDNLPWAIHIDGTFDYPKEYSPIGTAFNNYTSWANSNGSVFTDWYLDLPGYRNAANIY